MEPQSLISSIAGTAGGLGVVVWLIVFTVRQYGSAREADSAATSSQIARLNEEIQGLREEVQRLSKRVSDRDDEIDEERSARRKVEHENLLLRRRLTEEGIAWPGT